jgi:hypothetical protein
MTTELGDGKEGKLYPTGLLYPVPVNPPPTYWR